MGKKAVEANEMDRGCSKALKKAVKKAEIISLRQTRKGWCQECMGCQAKTEFKVFKDGDQIGHALEDAGFCCRCFCTPIYPFTMAIKDVKSEKEMITVERPFRCPFGQCKCCCYQTAAISSGGKNIGYVTEDFWICVPSMHAYTPKGEEIYKIKPPTCLGGCCINCCAEGNPCGRGCCMSSFRIYPADQARTNGGAPFDGIILKKPKSLLTEVFTDADAFDITFPEDASVKQKGILIGASVFLNANFFEGPAQEGDGEADAAGALLGLLM